MNFTEGLKINTSRFVETANDADYLSWASALSLAGRPRQKVSTFEGRPYLGLFGGALTCVEQSVGNGDAVWQQTWLPVLNASNAPVPLEKFEPRFLNDTLMRTRAKSVAMVSGVGLSLYAGYKGDSLAFIQAMGLKPDADLSQASPLVITKPKKPAYLSWAASLAAAKLTDPSFNWKVNTAQSVDHASGEVCELPVISVPGGYMVSVTVCYNGVEHTEILPIMGVQEVQTARGLKKMDHRPLPTPTVFDWNKAVMRCLTKAIAVSTGYGLNVYAKEDLQALIDAQNGVPVSFEMAAQQPPAQAKPQSPAQSTSSFDIPGRAPAPAKPTSSFLDFLPSSKPKAEPAKPAVPAAPASVAANAVNAAKESSKSFFDLGDFMRPPATPTSGLSSEDLQLVAEIERSLPDEGMRRRVLTACFTRKMVEHNPLDVTDLVKQNREAALQVLKSCQNQFQSGVAA